MLLPLIVLGLILMATPLFQVVLALVCAAMYWNPAQPQKIGEAPAREPGPRSPWYKDTTEWETRRRMLLWWVVTFIVFGGAAASVLRMANDGSLKEPLDLAAFVVGHAFWFARPLILFRLMMAPDAGLRRRVLSLELAFTALYTPACLFPLLAFFDIGPWK
ncbi:MAG: hypothetical protein AAB074_15445 [Planctomycetota bacterium]